MAYGMRDISCESKARRHEARLSPYRRDCLIRHKLRYKFPIASTPVFAADAWVVVEELMQTKNSPASASENFNNSKSERSRMRKFLSLYRLPILAGFLIGTSYIPFPPWALFFCLVPLFLFWVRIAEKPSQAFIGGWITQFILNLIGFHWIAYTAIEFGHFPWLGGVLTLIGFAAIAHLYYPLAGWLFHLVRRRVGLSEGASILTAATLFALCDHRFPMIFPWHLGYPWLWAQLPGAQFADVIGFEGLNIVTIYVNALIAWAIHLWWKRRTAADTAPNEHRKPFALVGAAIAVVLIINLLGLGRAEPWKRTDASINILAVQGNIGNFDKLMAEKGRAFRIPIIQKFLDLTRKGVTENPTTQIAIWPETAFPDLLDRPYENESNAVTVREFARAMKTPILTGSYSYDPHTKDTFNGFFFIDSMGFLPISPYRKSILLVFGETFPFSEYIPYMDKLFPDLGSFGRGPGPSIMSVSVPPPKDSSNPLPAELRVGPQICYEGLYPWFSAELSRKGAQIFTNVTNDSWFGRPFEPLQHLYMTMARAVEFRRPLMRSTNTGITTAVLASGEILQESPLHEEWAGMFHIPYLSNPPHTFYEKIAGQWAWVLAFGLILLILFGRNKSASGE